MKTLQVPATSANLGPGFDCLGLALGLWLRLGVEPAAPGAFTLEGGLPEEAARDSLLYKAYARGCRHLGLTETGVHLRLQSDIPSARGLGSSAAITVAGLAAAWLMAGQTPEKDAIFRLATELEGHPDNAAPAVYGGLRASLQEGDALVSRSFPLADALRFTALIPPFPLSTKKARAALPASLSMRDAVYNISHAVLTMQALAAGDLALLALSLRDKLHQPYRLPLIQGGEQVFRLVQQKCAAICISGAGPTLMCVSDRDGLADTLAPHLPQGWQAIDLRPNYDGLKVV